MILPIVGYGSPTLRKKSEHIDKDYPELSKLIEDMFETMYSSNGVGLAAPQIDRNISLVIIDADPLKDTYPEGEGFKRVLINPEIIEQGGEKWMFEEGCLSLPSINEEVNRHFEVSIRYLDEDFNPKQENLSGIRARVFLHEYDHLEGKLFIDRLSPLRRTLLKRKLSDIAAGRVETSYRMKMPLRKYAMILLALFAFASCQPKKAERLEDISVLEKRTMKDAREISVSRADSLLVLYDAYIADFPLDSNTAIMLFNAADVSSNIKYCDRAIGYLQRLADDFPESDLAEIAMFKMGGVYESSCNNNDKAKQAYKNFIDAFPQSQYAVDARILLEMMDMVDDLDIIREFEVRNAESSTIEN